MQTTDDRIRREYESFEASEEVTLFTFDTTMIGGGTYAFSPAPVMNAQGAAIAPVFNGITYSVFPMTSEGWEWSAGGDLPRPVVRFKVARESGDVSSAVASLMAVVEAMDDLVGAKVQRVKTLRRFLDDGADADPSVHFGVETYEVEQKTAQSKNLIEFQLSPGLDVEGALLPARQILNRCKWQYRRHDGQGGFTYHKCPYAGAAMFDVMGVAVVDPADDVCGKLLRHCIDRFGTDVILPFGGFPGSGRIGVQ